MTDTATLKKALLMIQKLKKKLHDQKNKVFEPMAIIGMSCRLPQANNTNEFWQLLSQGTNVISKIPTKRWQLLKGTKEMSQRVEQLPYWGGYLNDIDEFDPYFFGISPREAMRMDPQQRLLLEVAYESLEDAGLSIEAIRGTNMGVFSSLYASQFSHLQILDSDLDALLISTGSAVSIAANRFSYLFDLQGPSLALDTACSSSLIALQLACLSIQAKQCDTALVSAVNINLLPSLHSMLSKATMLSPTGQCHTFDAHADGYVQGEGAGSLVIKPLSKAIKDNDRIYAVIASSAVNQDGKTNGLTAPNGLQQERLLRSAYQAADIDPAQVSYLECHGTGTFLGDPIEVQAIGEVIGKNRDPQKPCWISSVKTNVGHLEPAAGIISIIKTALVLNHGIIPPHLNFTHANPHIPFDKYGLRIPTESQKLPQYSGNYIAGVSGFGFGGANAHIVLRTLSPEEQPAMSANKTQEGEELFTLSAQNMPALRNLIERWCTYLEANSTADLAQICYNLHLRRSHFGKRLAIITDSINDLRQKLKTLRINARSPMDKVYISPENNKSKTAFQINDFNNITLTSLAQHYVNHANINWQTYEAERNYRHIDMPLYPWQHKAYWPILSSSQTTDDNTNYPMRGKQLLSPLPISQFEFRFDSKTLPEVHDTFGVLHAGYYTEMLGYAFHQQHQTSNFVIENMTFSSPIFVPDGKTVLVHLTIEEQINNGRTFHFYSYDGKENWVKHATGKASLRKKPHPTIKEELDRIRHHYSSTGTSDSFYNRIGNMRMPKGGTIRWADQYWLDQKHILCQLRTPKPSDRPSQFIMGIHPGVIDACIQSLFLLLPEQITSPYIASSLGHLEFYKKPDENMFVYSELKEINDDGKIILGDWYLLDTNQSVIAKCSDLQLTQLGDTLQLNQDATQPSQFQLDLSLPYESCKRILIDFLIEQFSHIFSMPKHDIQPDQYLNKLGMDSLMALAIVQVIETNLEINYPLTSVMKGPTIESLAEEILTEKLINKHQDTNTQVPLKGLATEKEMDRNKSLEKNQVTMPEIKLTNIWIANRNKQQNPEIRLFCFPYGGGGASIYRQWQHHFPDYIEVCPIQLPGRENRIEELPLHSMESLVSTLATQLMPLLDLPFAFFGHSFGSLIAFELTRYLRKHNSPQPIHLFASAYPDPRKPSTSLNRLLTNLEQENIHLFGLNQTAIIHLDDKQLSTLTTIFRDNGIIDYADERMNKSIIQVLLPIFIADMNIVKNYVFYEAPPLDVDLTVFFGKRDTWVHPDELRGWEKHSLKSCDFIGFDSEHLFVREQVIQTKIINKINEKLQCHRGIKFES